MTIGESLKKITQELTLADIPTARLDALVLLEDVTGHERAWLLAHPEQAVDEASAKLLNMLSNRRSTHEPLAYIRGKSEFYGREFIVSAATLQPRPETETMIDLCKALSLPNGAVIADIGTGSGAIALTIKQELPLMTVLATEISNDALAIARRNARALQAEVEFYQGNLIEPITDAKIDVLLCNLPYLPTSHTINRAAMQEPAVAIFGGADGLELYREMFTQIDGLSMQPRYILTESLPSQHIALAAIAQASRYEQSDTQDFIQVFTKSL